MRFLILAIILLAPGLLFAVEHSGTVRAADQFIPGATVTARQGGAKLVTYTDENGRYSFDLTPGVWDIEVSMFGFKTITNPVTIKDGFITRDWVLEMPRPGDPVEAIKPATTEVKKPDTPAPATTTAAATPTPTPAATPAKPATATPTANGRRGTQTQSANGRGGRGRGQQGNQPGFQNADVTATDAGAQALANAGNDTPPDLSSIDTNDAFMVVGSTSGGLGVAADEQSARMAMAGRGGGRGGIGGGPGGPGGGDVGLMTLGASLGGADTLGMSGFGAAGADSGFGADAGGFGGAGGAGGGRGGAGAGGGGGGGRGGGGGGGRGGGGGGGGRGGAPGAGRGGRGPFGGQFASIGNRRGRGRPQSPYTGSIAVTATNSALNAAPYSLNGQNQTKPSTARESITGNIGGPLRIPKLYNVPNPKWQFYLNFTTAQARSGSSSVSEVPTPAERMGDFSAATVKSSTPGVSGYVPVTIFDPLSGSPFPGNIIPADRINKISSSLLQYIPPPTYTGIVQNYAISPSNPSHTRSFSVRLNGRVNNKNTLNINQQFSFNGSTSQELFGYKDGSNGYGLSSGVGWTHIFKPRFNNSLNLSFSRNITHTDPYFANRINVAGNLGIVGPDQTPQAWGPPNLDFTNFGDLNPQDYSSSRSQTTGFTDTVTYIYKRSHNFSFGLGYRRMQNNSLSFSNSGGTLNFNGQMTAGYDSTGTAIPGTGYDFADYLLGYPNTSTLRVNDSNLYYRGWAANAFAQDDWHFKPGLTINVGLRWEYFSPYTELHGQMATLDINSAMTLACPVGAAVNATNVSPASGCPPAAILSGPFSGAYPKALVNGDPREFSPRLGFSWRPSQKHSTLIGGGYSIFYSGAAYSGMARNLAGQPQFSTTANLSNEVSLVQAGDGLTVQCAFIVSPQCPNTPVPAAGTVTNTYAINKNYLPAYAQDWMVTLQETLPHNLLLQLEYIGIKGTRLDIVENPNQLPPNSAANLKGQVTNASGFIYETDTGNSIYNAGQVRFTRRMTRGISAVALYTFSKAIDDASGFNGAGQGSVVQNIYDLAAERGLSSTDQRHRLTISSVLSSPVGIHGMFRNGGWKTQVLTGWTLNPNFTIASGRPQTAMFGGADSNSRSAIKTSYRAEATGEPITGGNFPYFNENAFTTPAPGTYGNAGVDTIPGPWSFSLNAAMNRTWRFGESRKNLQVRLSANNALNHVQITGFGTTWGSSTWGLPTAATGTRTVSLLMRFSF